MTRARLPHSDIHGSRVTCTSPWLLAACHVLRRSPVPRHPPHALYILIYFLTPLNTANTPYDPHTGYACLSCQRPIKRCGAMRARTANLRRARAALSQLSYSPNQGAGSKEYRTRTHLLRIFTLSFSPCSLFLAPYSLMVGQSGVEPPTLRLSGVRSNQLSYWPSV
jgi:hypothetical protein